jgi:hypothetical protein
MTKSEAKILNEISFSNRILRIFNERNSSSAEVLVLKKQFFGSSFSSYVRLEATLNSN